MFTGKHGGIPLQSLSAKKRRRLTRNSLETSDDAHVPHEGSKEIARRRRQMERRLAKAKASQQDDQGNDINEKAQS